MKINVVDCIESQFLYRTFLAVNVRRGHSGWEEKHTEVGSENDLEFLSSNCGIKLQYLDQGLEQNRGRH